MSQPAGKLRKTPKRQNESTETESVRTINVRAPPNLIMEETPINGEQSTQSNEEDKNNEKKTNFMNWKDKLAAKRAEMVASLNAAVIAESEKIRNRLADNSSYDEDDVEVSDEEMEDFWNTTMTDSAVSSMPSATAIAIRNQPAVNFLNLEEEERIKGELKDTKNLRNKLYKIKKLMKKSVKGIRAFSEMNENAIASLHAATDDKCTDPTINELAAAAEKHMQEVKQSQALSNLETKIKDQILEQVKPINAHAKMISVTGKERRTARDRRIRLAFGEVDVTNEEEYNRSVDVVHDFEEKDRIYKDEFVNFREHNSSQLGQMLRCYLLETATYLETVAKAMREAAGGTANNYYLSNDCCTKFKDFKVDPRFLSPIPPLFSHINADHENDDRLTAKPQPQPQPLDGGTQSSPAVVGIPMMETHEAAEQSGYGSSAYTLSKDNTRVRRNIDDFLLTGQFPASDTNRMSPQPLPGRSPNTLSPQGKMNGRFSPSENSRTRPTSAFETSSTAKSLMDYIHSLADEYGVEPDFSVKRAAQGINREAMEAEKASNEVNEKGDNADGLNTSRPPSVLPRPKSSASYGSLVLPSLLSSGRATASTPVPSRRGA